MKRSAAIELKGELDAKVRHREQGIIAKAKREAQRQRLARVRLEERRLQVLTLVERGIDKEQEELREQGAIANPVIPRMKEFAHIYPELVEKYSIQYPIDD